MYIASTDSTNSLMARLLRGEDMQYAACLDEDLPLIYTGYQTSGRGQTGNGWESERGKNLMLTYLLRLPEVSPAGQFSLNILAAIVTHRTLVAYLPEQQRERLTIKWPNDIYYDDRKIAGILVENSLSGSRVQHSIAGVGINLNQERWTGNAPNPVSLKQITGAETDIHRVLQTFMQMLHFTIKWNADDCRDYYLQHLYRHECYHPYVAREVSTAPTMIAAEAAEGQFLARIEAILPTGEIVLCDSQGNLRTYHFKQIRFVI